MSPTTQQLLKDALALPPAERAALAEQLLFSLDRPDARIDALWAAEAEDRLRAYDAGELRGIPAEQVFAELDRA
jgi:putative addiction module component (TIGR02574 family)